jgi:farnesyl diphosphate synthase
MAANGNGPAPGGDTKAVFRQIYYKLKEELLADTAFEFTTESRQWIDRVTPSLPLLAFLFSLCGCCLPV